ncbi:MAG: nucleotidyltransferase family protein [Acidimicrobiales bacterium]
MRIRADLDIDDQRLGDICRRWHLSSLSVFGSVLTDAFGPDSDIDLLYEFEEGHAPGWDLVQVGEELEALFGRPVDLVGRRSLHWLIQDRVLAQARTLHAA